MPRLPPVPREALVIKLPQNLRGDNRFSLEAGVPASMILLKDKVESGTYHVDRSDPARIALLELLSHTASPLKARSIALILSRQLGCTVEKRAVNRILYQLKAQHVAEHDSQYRWLIARTNEPQATGTCPAGGHEQAKHEAGDELAQELELLLIDKSELLRSTAAEAAEVPREGVFCHRCGKPLPEEHDEEGIENLASQFCQCADRHFTVFSSIPQPPNLDWYDKRDDENLDWYDHFVRMRSPDTWRPQRSKT